MCGLAGWFGLTLPDKSQQEMLFRLLMRKAQVRGTDSYGVAFRDGREVRIRKGLGPASAWLARNPKNVRRISRSNVIIGHTRAASRGEVTVTNAHPFKVGGWIGAHNGTISNSGTLMVSSRYAPQGETDSEESLCWLASEGLTPEAFSALRGWFALTIVSRDASELIIAVDRATPFAIARLASGAVIWHSLAAALESSLHAVGLSSPIEEIKDTMLRLPAGEATPISSMAPPAIEPREEHLNQLEMEEFNA